MNMNSTWIKNRVGTTALNAVLIALVSVAIGYGLQQHPQHPKIMEQETLARSNVKQIGLAVLMYAVDYDDILPRGPKTADVFNEIYPYVKNRDIYNIPSPHKGQFQFNTHLCKVDTKNIQYPGKEPIVYDSKPWPDGSHPVCFLDGHAKTETAAEWAKTKKRLNDWHRSSTSKP